MSKLRNAVGGASATLVLWAMASCSSPADSPVDTGGGGGADSEANIAADAGPDGDLSADDAAQNGGSGSAGGGSGGWGEATQATRVEATQTQATQAQATQAQATLVEATQAQATQAEAVVVPLATARPVSTVTTLRARAPASTVPHPTASPPTLPRATAAPRAGQALPAGNFRTAPRIVCRTATPSAAAA